MKVFGWILLIIGVLIIFWTLYSSYNIFTGKSVVPEIFSSSTENYEGHAIASGKSEKIDIQAQMKEMIAEQLKGLMPADTVPKTLNLLIWSILAGIFIFGGAQVSSIGIKLIKK